MTNETEIEQAFNYARAAKMRIIIGVPKFIRALIKINYKETVAFEYEKDGKDPLPGLAESVGYLRGILAVI